MCMKNYNDEKIIFDKFTAFFKHSHFITIAILRGGGGGGGGILKALLAANF